MKLMAIHKVHWQFMMSVEPSGLAQDLGEYVHSSKPQRFSSAHA
jgi:hypothetical protein